MDIEIKAEPFTWNDNMSEAEEAARKKVNDGKS